MNYYKVLYCLLQKIYRQPLKKITYLATRPRFLTHGKALGGKAKVKALGGKAMGFKAKIKAENIGLKVKA